MIGVLKKPFFAQHSFWDTARREGLFSRPHGALCFILQRKFFRALRTRFRV